MIWVVQHVKGQKNVWGVVIECISALDVAVSASLHSVL